MASKLDFALLYEKTKKEVGFEDTDPIPYVVSTGSLLLDRALAIGGLPGGRIVEVFGPEASGKTTLCLHVLAEAQKKGLAVGYIDMETALDLDYAHRIGLSGEPNVDWAYAIPDTGEQVFETIECWIGSGVKVIMVDSVSAMVPKAELLGDYGESNIGLQARMMSQGFRKLTGLIYKSGALVVFINQIRMKIGVMFGNPETTTGGKALPFYASVRLDIRAAGEELLDGKDLIGRYSNIKVKKSKVGPPMRSVAVPLVFGHGFWKAAELFDVLLVEGFVSRRGSNYYFGDELIGQGKMDTIETLEKDMGRFLKAMEAKHEPKKSS